MDIYIVRSRTLFLMVSADVCAHVQKCRMMGAGLNQSLGTCNLILHHTAVHSMAALIALFKIA